MILELFIGLLLMVKNMLLSNLKSNLKRLYYVLSRRCIVCGKKSGKFRYCSIECACYDGVFNVRIGPAVEKPRIFKWRKQT